MAFIGGVHMLTTFIILIVTTILFIHGKYRSDFIAVGSLLALTITGTITPTEALAGFSNSVVIMIAGLFIVGAGIFNTGLAEKIGRQLISLSGNSEVKQLIIIMLTVGVFSAFISNTGTVAILLPVVISVALSTNVSPAKLLIPLAFASSLGGVVTLIGTPPNLIASNVLAENGYEPLHFFQFTPIGLVALGAGIVFMITIGRKILPNYNVATKDTESISPQKLAGIYKVYDSLHLIKVTKSATIVNKTLEQLDLTTKHGITVVSIERKQDKTISILNQNVSIVPKAKTTFNENDVVLLFGKKENIEKIINKYQLETIKLSLNKDVRKKFLTNRFGISEMLIPPQSIFINKTIRELHFRKKWGCTVLAIYRNGKFIRTDAGKQKLQTGDALLIHGEWEKIETLAKTSNDVIVVGRVSETVSTEFASGKAGIATLIMLFMLLLMILEIVDPVIAVLISAFLMILTGCVRSMEDGYRHINWESIILFAAMLPMANALENTGGVHFLSQLMINTLGSYGPIVVLAGFYFLTTVLSQFISNTATAVIVTPIAITTAIELSVNPYPFVITVAVAASMAFATPIASPTNTLVMNAGGYTFKDYVKIGVPLQLFLAIILLIFIPIFYPL